MELAERIELEFYYNNEEQKRIFNHWFDWSLMNKIINDDDKSMTIILKDGSEIYVQNLNGRTYPSQVTDCNQKHLV